MSLVQRLIAKGELEDSWELRAALAAQRQHASAKAGNAGTAPTARASHAPPRLSPMEAAARQAADGRDSTEILDEHELDRLRLSEPPSAAVLDRAAAALDQAAVAALDSATSLSAPFPQVARPAQRAEQPAAEEPHEALLVRPRTQPGVLQPARVEAQSPMREPSSVAARARTRGEDSEEGAEPTVRERVALAEPSALLRAAELADDARLRQHPQMSDEDFVPTRMARRSLVPAAQRVPPEILETPVFRDREITERISVPPLASSLAPASRTVRPHLRPQKGMGGWQLALVAMLLIGAGLGVARLRRESAAATLTARVRSAVAAALEPSPVAEVIAQPVLQPPAQPAPATSAAAPEPNLVADSAAVEPAPAPAALPAPVTEGRAARKARAAQESPGRARAADEALLAQLDSAREPASQARESSEPAGRAAAAAPSASDLPPQPSRDDVRAALRAVIPDLQKCTGALHGTADVTMTVRSAGVVSYAVVAGSFAGTPEGSCIARTVKLAKFPAFSEPTVRVSYPFEL
jgi:hypothetical protein